MVYFIKWPIQIKNGQLENNKQKPCMYANEIIINLCIPAQG